MPRNLVIDGITYAYPESGEVGWAAPATDWAEAVTDKISEINVVGDLSPNALFTIINNQAAPANVSGLSFNVLQIRGVVIEYSIYRNTSTTEKAETGTLYLIYKTVAASWEWARTYSGEGGVNFSVTNAGQVQYTSDSMGGTGYVGNIRYRARVLRSV